MKIEGAKKENRNTNFEIHTTACRVLAQHDRPHLTTIPTIVTSIA